MSEKISEAIVDFVNSIEAACVQLKRYVSEQQAKQEKPWSADSIKWVQAEGTKGPYERYPAEDKKPENTPDYQNMLADLKEHDGKLTRDGLFYWCFTDNATVGRKKRSF